MLKPSVKGKYHRYIPQSEVQQQRGAHSAPTQTQVTISTLACKKMSWTKGRARGGTTTDKIPGRLRNALFNAQEEAAVVCQFDRTHGVTDMACIAPEWQTASRGGLGLMDVC